MGSYSFSQLEQLWTQAGGSGALAPVMAAIALAESSGNPSATNVNTNGTIDRGLWQINSSNLDSTSMFDPMSNAIEAVKIYSQQGLHAWSTYNNGAYQQFLQGGAKLTAQTPESTPPIDATTTASVTSLNPSDALNEMGTLLHGVAQGLNMAFWFFEPGQGWRFVFGVGGVASGIGAAKLYMSPNVQQEKSAAFPLAILLTGTSFLFLYMTFRAWPQNSDGQAMRPATYAWMIVTGKKPPAGPQPADHTTLIEGGLAAIASIWIINKAASAVGNVASSAGALAQIWAAIKGLFKGGGGEPVPIPEVPVASFEVQNYPGLTG